MRRTLGILIVAVVAAAGGVLLALPSTPAPALQAQPVPVSILPTATTTTTDPNAPATSAPLTGPFQVALVNNSSVAVHTAPDGPVLKSLSNPLYTLPLLFLVKSAGPGDWLQVRLPVRPNGGTGYVKTSDVKLSSVNIQVLVEQRFRRLSVWDGGRLVFETPVAVGKGATPTPNGTFYMQGVARMPNPGGAYGPFILVLSSHSEVLQTFAGGDGLVGMHGTNQPNLIGQAVSNGCIRMPNASINRLADLVPGGAPVTVVP
jgi:lipoprotein-anchoring transpeptidase ErfK/SrfK